MVLPLPPHPSTERCSLECSSHRRLQMLKRSRMGGGRGRGRELCKRRAPACVIVTVTSCRDSCRTCGVVSVRLGKREGKTVAMTSARCDGAPRLSCTVVCTCTRTHASTRTCATTYTHAVLSARHAACPHTALHNMQHCGQCVTCDTMCNMQLLLWRDPVAMLVKQVCLYCGTRAATKKQCRSAQISLK